MPELDFRVEGAEPDRFSVAPLLLFKLRVSEVVSPGSPPTPIHAVVLRCQIRIEPARRRYVAGEPQKLFDLFGTPDRWSRTLRPMLWTHTGVVVPPMAGAAEVDLPVPCTFDFNLAATKYFDALEGGDIPLCFLFSGTIFYEDGGTWQAAPISWEKEADFRLPAATWRTLMERHYPDGACLTLRKDVFDRLAHYRSRNGLVTWEQAIERLLAPAEEPVTP